MNEDTEFERHNAYALLLFIYSAVIFWTYFLHITDGVETIQTIQPLWEGTDSGLLWPWLFHLIGFVDENDQPTFMHEEVLEQFDDLIHPGNEDKDEAQIDQTIDISRDIDDLDDFNGDSDSTTGLDDLDILMLFEI